MSVQDVAIYGAVGAFAGVLAGLLGIGGGLVIVPALSFVYAMRGVDGGHVQHLALGTSLASILFTSVASFLSHHRRGAVLWPAVVRISPGILAGGFAGTAIAGRLSTFELRAILVVFLYAVAVQFFIDRKLRPGRGLPEWPGFALAGAVIGIVSSLVGIGGGSLSVPFLVWCSVAVRTAVGTSAAIGFPIALAGTLGFVYQGLRVSGLPDFTLGFVHLPALAGIVVPSVLCAPLGARLAHRLPARRLRRLFAAFLFVAATRMLAGIVARSG
jgi:uncharacterized membrane protein YfcA